MSDDFSFERRPSGLLSRRSLLTGFVVGAGAMLTGCDMLNENESFRKILSSAETGNFAIQRALSDRNRLAPTYGIEMISQDFPANGTRDITEPAYLAMAANGFADWPLTIDGLVSKPTRFTMAQLKTMPHRTQITKHDCVEGWTAIGQWTGIALMTLLNQVQLRDAAKYLVFHCADTLYGRKYYESIDLVDAFHPQTMLAWGLNGKPLQPGNGAPLRLRVERQLGYKHAKYVQRIEAVSSLTGFYGGKGGYWEDSHHYQWYAGI